MTFLLPFVKVFIFVWKNTFTLEGSLNTSEVGEVPSSGQCLWHEVMTCDFVSTDSEFLFVKRKENLVSVYKDLVRLTQYLK